ncbi:MAG: alpha/beta hydrolase [Sphingobium sp.]
MARVLEALEGSPGMESMSLAALRASMAPLPMALRTPVGKVRDLMAGERPARLYEPAERKDDALILFFHGGGFVLGSIETHDHVARDLCATSGCRVLSADYRLAPEFPFPAAPDDCLSVWLWVQDNAGALDVDPARVFLAGDSAGGNLALVTALRLRDGGRPMPSALMLAYPVTDYHTPPTASYIENAEGYSLTRAAMIRFWADYLPDPADAALPYASPLRADTFAGFPPTLVLTAQFDPLRDEGTALADRLKSDDVLITHIRHEGLIHGFLRMGSVSIRARQAFDAIADWIASLRL